MSEKDEARLILSLTEGIRDMAMTSSQWEKLEPFIDMIEKAAHRIQKGA